MLYLILDKFNIKIYSVLFTIISSNATEAFCEKVIYSRLFNWLIVVGVT